MANASKQKGDRSEREAVETLKLFCPHLLVENPWRMLGAGRKDDVGDLRVFADVAVQVRAYKSLGAAIRSAAVDAVEQAGRAGQRLGVGMVPIPNRPRLDPDAVRWLACTAVDDWPDPSNDPRYEFGSVSKLTDWLDMRPTTVRPDVLPINQRIGVLTTQGCEPVVVAPIQAWIASFERRLRVDRGFVDEQYPADQWPPHAKAILNFAAQGRL